MADGGIDPSSEDLGTRAWKGAFVGFEGLIDASVSVLTLGAYNPGLAAGAEAWVDGLSPAQEQQLQQVEQDQPVLSTAAKQTATQIVSAATWGTGAVVILALVAAALYLAGGRQIA